MESHLPTKDSAVDFFEVRRILMELEKKGVSQGSSKEYLLTSRNFWMFSTEEGNSNPPIREVHMLTVNGKDFLNVIRDEARLRAILKYAEQQGLQPNFDNMETIITDYEKAHAEPPLVFISWSKERAEKTALILQKLLEQVLPVRVFVSSRDLRSNATGWRQSIFDHLQAANYGIVILTDEHRESPWLMYESGALEMRLDFENLSVLTLDVPPNALPSPLAHKQVRRFDADGLTALLEDIRLGLKLNSAPPPEQKALVAAAVEKKPKRLGLLSRMMLWPLHRLLEQRRRVEEQRRMWKLARREEEKAKG